LDALCALRPAPNFYEINPRAQLGWGWLWWWLTLLFLCRKTGLNKSVFSLSVIALNFWLPWPKARKETKARGPNFFLSLFFYVWLSGSFLNNIPLTSLWVDFFPSISISHFTSCVFVSSVYLFVCLSLIPFHLSWFCLWLLLYICSLCSLRFQSTVVWQVECYQTKKKARKVKYFNQ
jgi:hypothetical protein